MSLFPLFLKLEGRRCLAVGAGTIGEGKIASLLEAGARVTVVAPEATEAVRSWATAGRVEWKARKFQPEDLDGMFLVIAATSSPAVQEGVFAEAGKRNVLCNVVDVPDLCDFYYPAIVRRGGLQIAISTAGQSPALAQRLRQELEVQFGEEYGEWVESLGRERDEIMARNLDPEERKNMLHKLAGAESFRKFRDTKYAKKKSPDS